MRTIEQSPDRLVLRQPPVLMHAVATTMVVIGFGMIGLGIVGITMAAAGSELLLQSIIGAVLGAFVVVAAPVVRLLAVNITVTLDRAAGLVRIERERWFDRDERTVPLSAVEDAVLESTDCDGSLVYRIALRLSGGPTIPLTEVYDDLNRWKRAAIDAIRDFLSRGDTTASTTHNA